MRRLTVRKLSLPNKFLWFLIVFFTIFPFVYAQQHLPPPTGFVNDFVGIISQQDKGKLEALFFELEKKTEAEVCVVTVETTQPLDIETFAVKLFEQWGIGKKEKDNGVLMVIAFKDRRVRIEVGYGLEGVISDALAYQIINRIVIPYFKKERYSQGIVKASYAIVNLIAKEYNVTLSEMKNLGKLEPVNRDTLGRKLIGSLFSLLFLLLLLGCRWGFLWWWILVPGTYHRRNGYWYGGGYGGYSGGFSGGFGGFGGGLSGGGGASGSW